MFVSKITNYILKSTLPIGIGLIIVMLVSTSFFTFLDVQNHSRNFIQTAKIQNTNSELLKTMNYSVYRRSIIIAEMLHTTDQNRNETIFSELNQLAKDFTEARNEFETQDLDPKLQKKLDTQGHLISINGPQLLDVYESIQNDDLERAEKLFVDVTLPRQKINQDLIQQMVDLQSWLEQDKLEETEEHFDKNRLIIVVVNLIIVVMSLLLSFIILRRQKKADRRLNIKATTDPLTKLPNRSRLIKNINEFIRQKPTHTFAVLFFDIDFFKSINDNFGHSVGDLVIQKFAIEIKSQIKRNDILSRFGGDEFVLLLRSIRSEKEAREFVTKLSSRLNTSFQINNKEIFITASVGVSLFDLNSDEQSAKDLLKHADIAMYSAKESGRNCYQFFSKENSDKLSREYSLSHSLHTLLKSDNRDDELYLVYQPLVNINDCGVSECEALIRWKTSNGQDIYPNEFIPLAEKSNLIEKINLFVIDAACKQQYEWQKNEATKIRVNLNLSGNRYIFEKLLKRFEEHMTKYSLYPSQFGIELTERTLFEISKETIRKLDFLRRQGMKISIDDFGTEYSSLSYLKKLPITTLKIDKSFISGIPDDKDDKALVKSIISIGHSLQLDVVAEGVENDEQLQFLKDNACNVAQGFYLYEPLNSQYIYELKSAA